jgi:hypothetical protein
MSTSKNRRGLRWWPRLYWGFARKTIRCGSYLIAEPEKTILDRIYLGIRNVAAPALDELDFTDINNSKRTRKKWSI